MPDSVDVMRWRLKGGSANSLPMIRAVVLIVMFAAATGCDPKKPAPPAVPAAAMDFYATRATFERPVTVAGTVPGIPNVRSETCGACHTEIYAEWRVSTHARAWLDDAQFQAELSKSRGDVEGTKGDVGWLCVNCHTPAVEQLPKLVVALTDGDIAKPTYVENPRFDPNMQNEAIGCATCHVENGKIYGPWGTTRAPHPVARRDSLLTEEVCTRCHQAEQFYVTQNLGCFFDTGVTWASSPNAKRGETCQHCHMPEVERPLMPGLPARKTRRHWFGGSLIPKKPEFAAELAPLEAVFGDGVTITVEPWSTAHETELAGQVGLAAPDEAIAQSTAVPCAAETCKAFAVVVTNDRAGHTMPTGDPERHIDVVAVSTAGGAVVSRAWTRIGSRYQWWPETKRLADTRIAPGARRLLRVEAPVGSTLEVTAHKYRMYQEAWDHHELEGKSVRGREFHRSRRLVE